MARRGETEKLSISLPREDVAALRARARRLHGGNLSSAIAELAADARLLEGMHELIAWLGGPSLTDEERAKIEREWRGEGSAGKTVRRKKVA